MDMTVEEKRDLLVEVLADFYDVKNNNNVDNPVLDRKIRIFEKRLEVLGVTDLNDLK